MLRQDHEWVLSLDLLIARAALDQQLRASLLEAPRETCKANGVNIPQDVQLVITHSDRPTLIREIPSTLPAASFEKTSETSLILEPAVYNGTITSTAAVAQTAEVEASVTTTTGEVEMEVGAVAVAVIVLS